MTRKSTPLWESPILWVVGLIVFAVVATVILAAGDDSDPTPATTGPETAFAELLSAPLPVLDAPDTALGATVPAISAQTLDGDRVQVSPDGTARLYGFFAHWCPHCQRELPRVGDWIRANGVPDGVEILAVSTAVEPTAENYPPSSWFPREDWPARVLLDDAAGTLAAGFGLSGYPYWVVADAEGHVVARTSGELTTEQFAALVASVTPAFPTAP